jgi:tetratricopeptide (TPR) repeat protein
MSEHPTAAELESLVRGDLDREEARSVVRHLLHGCDDCLARIAPYAGSLLDGINPAREARAEGAADAAPRPRVRPAALLAQLFRAPRARRGGNPSRPGIPATPANPADREPAGELDGTLLAVAYDRAIDRAFAAVMRHGENAARAGARVRRLVAQLSADELFALSAQNMPAELRSFSGYDALLDRSLALRRDDPRQMVKLAELATLVAGGLADEGFSAGQVEDFQARAAIELANAYRVVDRLQQAQATLDAARAHFRAGSQDRLLGARLLEVGANIHGDLEDFDAAFAALDAAIRTYRRHGDPHLEGRCLIKKGLYTAHAGRQEAAIELLSAGLEKIDAAQDPRMALAAIHNTAFCLMSSNRCREARSLLWRHHALYQRHAGRQDRLKLRWLQGQIYAGMNELDQAESALEEARHGLREAGRGHNAATATLELAEVRLRQGKESEAGRLGLEAAELFLDLEVSAEEAAAMRLLKAQFEAALVSPAPPTPLAPLALLAPMSELVEEAFKLLRAAVAARSALASNRSA